MTPAPFFCCEQLKTGQKRACCVIGEGILMCVHTCKLHGTSADLMIHKKAQEKCWGDDLWLHLPQSHELRHSARGRKIRKKKQCRGIWKNKKDMRDKHHKKGIQICRWHNEHEIRHCWEQVMKESTRCKHFQNIIFEKKHIDISWLHTGYTGRNARTPRRTHRKKTMPTQTHDQTKYGAQSRNILRSKFRVVIMHTKRSRKCVYHVEKRLPSWGTARSCAVQNHTKFHENSGQTREILHLERHEQSRDQKCQKRQYVENSSCNANISARVTLTDDSLPVHLTPPLDNPSHQYRLIHRPTFDQAQIFDQKNACCLHKKCGCTSTYIRKTVGYQRLITENCAQASHLLMEGRAWME